MESQINTNSISIKQSRAARALRLEEPRFRGDLQNGELFLGQVEVLTDSRGRRLSTWALPGSRVISGEGGQKKKKLYLGSHRTEETKLKSWRARISERRKEGRTEGP